MVFYFFIDKGALCIMGDCFICNKHQGRITTASMSVYEDDFVYVGHIDRNGQPNYLGQKF